MRSKSLTGKVALVTGSGQNIGRGIALNLAASGASVVINGRTNEEAVNDTVEEIKRNGGEAVGCMADVSNPKSVNDMIEKTNKIFGGLDILVCNAGLRRQTPFIEMTFSEWREILSVALDGAFILSQAVVPLMIERGAGSIVALSGVSHHIGILNRCHVSASKAGLEGLMRSLAIELAPHKITCNCIAPGLIDTVRGGSSGKRPTSSPTNRTPIQRMGKIEEVASLINVLVGPSGGFTTGQTIHVNGGLFLT
jgi:3-oxoacyl-[acyl-carrier protein] reductase